MYQEANKMADKNIKISKDSIWWIVKHMVGVMLAYIIYSKVVPFGETFTFTIYKIGLLNFSAYLIIIIMTLLMLNLFLVELASEIIRIILTKLGIVNFKGVTLFNINIPVTQEMIDAFDKEYKRKKVAEKYVDRRVLNKENDYEFCKRIITKGGKK